MLNQISSTINTIPLSVYDCLINGEIDIHHYKIYMHQKQRNIKNLRTLDSLINKTRKRSNIELESPLLNDHKPRSVKKHKLLYRDDDGTRKNIEHLTHYGICYI